MVNSSVHYSIYMRVAFDAGAASKNRKYEKCMFCGERYIYSNQSHGIKQNALLKVRIICVVDGDQMDETKRVFAMVSIIY